MSAAANAAGYLYAAGILGRRKQEREQEVRYRMTERYDDIERTTAGTMPVKPVPVTYRKRRA